MDGLQILAQSPVPPDQPRALHQSLRALLSQVSMPMAAAVHIRLQESQPVGTVGTSGRGRFYLNDGNSRPTWLRLEPKTPPAFLILDKLHIGDTRAITRLSLEAPVTYNKPLKP